MSCEDEDNELPCPEALIAGTLALMTGWADMPADNAEALGPRRHLLARKIISNLFFLQHHPGISPELRQVMANAHQRWAGIVRDGTEATPMPVISPEPVSRTLH